MLAAQLLPLSSKFPNLYIQPAFSLQAWMRSGFCLPDFIPGSQGRGSCIQTLGLMDENGWASRKIKGFSATRHKWVAGIRNSSANTQWKLNKSVLPTIKRICLGFQYVAFDEKNNFISHLDMVWRYTDKSVLIESLVTFLHKALHFLNFY